MQVLGSCDLGFRVRGLVSKGFSLCYGCLGVGRIFRRCCADALSGMWASGWRFRAGSAYRIGAGIGCSVVQV